MLMRRPKLPLAQTLSQRRQENRCRYPRQSGFNLKFREPTKGFEPPTHALRKHCSTPELRRLGWRVYFTRWLTRQATWRYSSRPRTARSLIASSAHGPQTRWSAWQSRQYIRREADSPRPQKAHSPSMARGCTSPSAVPCLLMVAGWLCRRSTCARGWCDSQRRPYCWAQDLHGCPSESPTNFRRQALAAVWSLRRLPSLHGLRPRPSSLPMPLELSPPMCGN